MSHAVHQNGVVGAGGAVAVNAVYVGKAGMVSATVKERLTVPESIESILVGYGVRGTAVRTAAEAEHGAFAGIVQVGGERGQSALREYMSHGKVFQTRPVRQGLVALQAEPCKAAGFRGASLFEYVGLAGADVAHIICGKCIAGHTRQSIGVANTRTARGKYLLVRAAVAARFGEWRLLVDDVQGISLIPGVGEIVEAGEAGIEIRHFHKCTDVDVEVGVAVVPGSVLVQTGEAGEPQVIAIVRPRIGFGQFTVNGKGCHGEDAEGHLPHMVVGDVVFQAVDIVHVHAVAEFFYFVQQESARGIVQNIVQCVVCHGAERKQGGFVEVAHHVFVVSPGGHLLDALHGFVGIAAVFGEQVGADKYVGIRFFAVDDAAAFAGEHGIFLHLVGQPFCQVRVNVVYRLHRGGKYFVGTFEVSLAFGFALAALYETVPFVPVEPYTGVVGRQVLKYGIQCGRAELPGIVLYRKLQRIAPFGLSVRNIAVLPVPCARSQILFGVEERPARLGLYSRFRLECRSLRVAQEVA